jgi:hypothetical protein
MNEVTARAPQPETVEAVDPTPDQVMAECVAIESEKRKWLRGITAFLAGQSHEEFRSEMVQTACDLATTAALDRVSRLMRSDDPAEDR